MNLNTINKIKDKYKSKFSLWYEDHLIKGGPNYINNLNLIEKNDISKELTIFAQYETDNSVEGYFHKKFPIMRCSKKFWPIL